MVGVMELKKFVQVYNSKAHWIFESEVQPEFAPDIVIMDITGQNEIQEGWVYDEVLDTFTAPVLPEPVEPTPQIEQQILFETQYQTLLLEMMSMGGAI